jgi:hypothetical protein
MKQVMVSPDCLNEKRQQTTEITSAARQTTVVPRVCYAKKPERAGGTDHDSAELDRDEKLEVGGDLYRCESGSGNEE